MPTAPRADLICFCHLRWNFVFQRPQHLLVRWSRRRRVFFFEEPAFVDGPSELCEQVLPETSIDARATDASRGVIVVTPKLHKGLSRRQSVQTLRSMVDALMVKHDVGDDTIAWYYTPMALEFTDHLRPALTVYDCMDELSAFQGAPPELTEMERRLLARADVVFTGGQSLFEAKRHSHDDIHPFPSAVDVAHFRAARDMKDEPPDQAAIPGPRFGFYGVLDERLDVPLIASLAARRPDWHLVMVGPVVKIDPGTLPRLPNVHYLGQKTYEELPHYLAGWDVALLPFARNESTRFISPTKTPEYLAGGKPVVSTSIRDVVRPYGEMGLVRIADTAEDLEAAIAAAMEDDREARLAKVDELLADRSWDATWQGMSDHVDRLLAGKGRTTPARPRQRRPAKVSFDVLVVGAGFAGSVMAERLAVSGKRVLLVDKRAHLAGNAYDHADDAGVLIHRYGPHIFHTNSPDVFAYLSRFTEWRPYEHRVLAAVDGKLLPIPINLDTVNRLYGWDLDSAGVEAFFQSVAEPRARIRTSEDVIVSKVGRELYEKFFKHYTRKQWGLDPSELDATVIARIPVRTDRDDRYFTDKLQFMPRDGYTAMFENLVDHPNITVELGTDYRELNGNISYQQTVYSGPVDAFFDHCYGKLPYRSLDFRFETHAQERFQAVAVVNYPNEHDYTRITEFKHLTGQKSERTTVVYEYPRADGEPYYPIPRPENAALYARYQALAEATPNVHFVGRLATYKYYNMDQVVAQALTLAAKLEGVSRGELLERTAGASEPFVQMPPAPRAEPATAPMELWGGLECTVNRVGDRYFDQLSRSGHRERLSDFDRVAALGIRVLRYPIAWETVAAAGPGCADWTFADAALQRMRGLGMRPIVGLVHHGSGPSWTNLLDESFADGLADHARQCAERYPWIEDWTPVNEPLTTARFSALYGFWYPHACNTPAFARAVLNQCRATVLAMRAIRRVNPKARLVQTEDVGTIRATASLQYQADYENERRWLSLDLLCGKVLPGTLAWSVLRTAADEAELARFADEPCPPDMVGVNYYVTSDRFLDHRLELYPRRFWGGNEREPYADIEAVRSPDAPAPDHAVSLKAAAERYGMPVAITECHLDSTREEQLRWLMQGWNAAESVRRQGHDVRAVTVWALNGAFDWNSLVTVDSGHYEPGAFDLRAIAPRPTAVAKLATALATAPSEGTHPVLATPGWWQRPERVWHGQERLPSPQVSSSVRPIVITGGRGTLARAFVRACEQRGLPFHVLPRCELDIANPAQIHTVLDEIRPWAVVNAAGFVRVDDAEAAPDACFRENTLGPAYLARACRDRGIRLLTFSSDLVFDGSQHRPYVESDRATPLSVYGRSKLLAEERVLSIYPDALVVRTSAFFGPWDEHNFVVALLRSWQQGHSVRVPNDLVISPTYVPDLVRAALDFVIDGEHGIWHLANGGAVTWADLAHQVAALAHTTAYLEECENTALDRPAPRPRYSALGSERGGVMPPLESSLERFFVESEYRGRASDIQRS